LRLAGKRSDQNRSSRNSSHSESASQHAPHCRGRESRNCDSFNRTMEASGKVPSHRSSGNNAKVFGRSAASSNTSIDRRHASSCESLISPR
jgi:hypothetical protein